MSPSPHRHTKNKKKAILHSPSPLTQEKKLTDKQKAHYLASSKTVKINRGKTNRKVSRRASPQDVSYLTEPEHVHQEGRHWINVIQKQTIHFASKLTAKLKRKGK